MEKNALVNFVPNNQIYLLSFLKIQTLIYAVKNQNGGYFWPEVVTGKGHEGIWGYWNVILECWTLSQS